LASSQYYVRAKNLPHCEAKAETAHKASQPDG
jgi:hypothetical protein